MSFPKKPLGEHIGPQVHTLADKLQALNKRMDELTVKVEHMEFVITDARVDWDDVQVDIPVWTPQPMVLNNRHRLVQVFDCIVEDRDCRMIRFADPGPYGNVLAILHYRADQRNGIDQRGCYVAIGSTPDRVPMAHTYGTDGFDGRPATSLRLSGGHHCVLLLTRLLAERLTHWFSDDIPVSGHAWVVHQNDSLREQAFTIRHDADSIPAPTGANAGPGMQALMTVRQRAHHLSGEVSRVYSLYTQDIHPGIKLLIDYGLYIGDP